MGIIEVLHHCITADQARSTLEVYARNNPWRLVVQLQPDTLHMHTHTQVAQLPADQQVDVRLFAAICCLAERMHNLYYL